MYAALYNGSNGWTLIGTFESALDADNAAQQYRAWGYEIQVLMPANHCF